MSLAAYNYFLLSGTFLMANNIKNKTKGKLDDWQLEKNQLLIFAILFVSENLRIPANFV